MAFLFADGFDHYAVADITTKWTQLRAGANFVALAIGSTGRHSSNGLSVAQSSGFGQCSQSVGVTLSPANATAIVGLAFKTNTMSVGTSTGGDFTTSGCPIIMGVRQGGTTQVWFRLNTDGTITAYQGASTVLGTTSVALNSNIFSYLEFKVLIDPTVGTVDIRKDGVSILSLTGKNTRTTASSTWNEIAICACAPPTGGAATWTYDDIYILDSSGATSNNFLGDVRVDVRLVNGAGDLTAWTPDSGSNFARVNEATFDGDTSYVSAATINAIDTYTTAAQPVSGAQILAIQANLMTKKVDAGTVGIKPVVRISGVNYLGTEQNPTAGYTDVRQIYDTNPATSVAWVDGDIGPGLAQFGIDKST